MKTLVSSSVLAAILCSGSASGSLIITGVFDGPLPGGDPKGVEIYATTAIADLSLFAIGSANNGGGTDGPEAVLPTVSLAAGQFFYIANSADGHFTQWFGFAPDHLGAGGGVNHNGDDAIELFFDPTGAFSGGESVIDVFGDINTDGSGQPWDSLDGWAYRNDGVGANGGTFDANNWSFSGANAWDRDDNFAGGTDNGTNLTATPPFPTGSYVIPEPTIALLGGLSLLFLLRRRN
jgi:hypothetical protein